MDLDAKNFSFLHFTIGLIVAAFCELELGL